MINNIVRLIFIVGLLIIGSNLLAQDKAKEAETEKDKKEDFTIPPKTLFDVLDRHYSGYASAVYTKGYAGLVPVTFAGGRAGTIIDRKWTAGVAVMSYLSPNEGSELLGTDFTDTMTTDSEGNEVNYFDQELNNFQMGYAGACFEHYFFPTEMLHISIGVTVGKGYMAWSKEGEMALASGTELHYFNVVEPELRLWLNLSRHVRLGVGTSYLYLDSLDDDVLGNSRLFNGPTTTFMLTAGGL